MEPKNRVGRYCALRLGIDDVAIVDKHLVPAVAGRIEAHNAAVPSGVVQRRHLHRIVEMHLADRCLTGAQRGGFTHYLLVEVHGHCHRSGRRSAGGDVFRRRLKPVVQVEGLAATQNRHLLSEMDDVGGGADAARVSRRREDERHAALHVGAVGEPREGTDPVVH